MSDGNDRQLLLPPERPEGYEDFAGRYERTVDEKGRMVLPPALRDTFGGVARLTIVRDRIAMWTARSWSDAAGRIQVKEIQGDYPSGTHEAFHTYTEVVAVDGQGRVPLPAWMREDVGIGADGFAIAIVGLGAYLAIGPSDRKPAMSHDQLKAVLDPAFL